LLHAETKENKTGGEKETTTNKSEKKTTKVRKAKTQVSVSKKKVKFKLKFGAINNTNSQRVCSLPPWPQIG